MKNLTLAALLMLTGAAQAETLVALSGGKTLTWVDTETKKATGAIIIAGEALAGFDVRPSDGKLYGLTLTGNIVVLDPKTGAITAKSVLSEKLMSNINYAVDFNPVADRMRILGSDGTSYRVNVEDGKAIVDGSLKYAETDANKGKTPKVLAGAYTNSVAGTKETALYNIDVATSSLVKQAPPNDGILSSIGALGITLGSSIAFDIGSDGMGKNWGYLASGGSLYNVDLATGAAKLIGAIEGLKGDVSDIAILPKM